MINKISEQELVAMEMLANPIAANEILFSDLDNLIIFNEKYSHVRTFQYPFLSFDTMLHENPNKTDDQIFAERKGMAEIFALGGRLTGKSLFGIKTDVPVAALWRTFKWGVISSLDKLHLTGVIESIISIFDNHPIFKELKMHMTKSPNYRIEGNNVLVESVNNNIKGKEPGDQWYSKHVDRNWEEEASFVTDKVTHKKFMAKGEKGMIRRYSGMTTFAKTSPMGKIFYDIANQKKIVNLPSYASPRYTVEDDRQAIEEFDGKESVGYQVQIVGKVMDNCDAVYDTERIQACYKKDISIKSFEITKENYFRYKEIIVIERPNNVEKVIVATDVGEGSAPTEIIIIFKIGKKYRYEYNITVNKITPDELYDIFRFVILKVNANIIAVDNTSGVGKALVSNLSLDYASHVEIVDFNSKLPVDFEREKDGSVKVDANGNPIYKEEYVVDWSVQCIKNLFYNRHIDLLMDYKFDKQITNVVVMRTGKKVIYGCKVANHLYQAFQVFAIAEWRTEFANINPVTEGNSSNGCSFNF